MEKERFIALVQRYLDGTLDEPEARELHAAIASSDELREQLRTQAAMHAVMARRFKHGNGTVGRRVRAALRDPNQKKGAITRIMDKLSAKRPKKKDSLLKFPGNIDARRSRRTIFLIAASVAVTLLGVTSIYRFIAHNRISDDEAAWKVPATMSPVARAKPQSGVATVTRNGNTLLLKKERPMLAGDVIATSASVAIALEYPDKTSIKMPGDSKLSLQPAALKEDAGIAIDLTQGELEADVAPQPSGHPMIVSTPHGRAVIVGTRFKLSASAAQSKLDVIEGKVRFSSALKEESVLVEKGKSAVLSPGMPLEVAATVRDPAQWPFSAQSPWNYPLGSGAKFAPIDSPRFDPATGAELIVDSYAIPIYITAPGDPERLIYRQTKSDAKMLRMPADAKPDPSEMKYMNIIDERHSKVYELIGVKLEADGSIHLGSNSYSNSLLSRGVYDDNKQHGTRVYGGSSMGGIIRKDELNNGIPHALGVGVAMAALNGYAPGGKPYVWPASNALVAWESLYGKNGNLHLGSLLAISPDVDIRKIGVGTSGPAYEIARALQDYGAYIVEHSTEATHDLKFYFDPAARTQIPKSLDSQMALIMKYLKVVTNNSPQNVGGGGTPRRPLAPPFAKEFLDKAGTDE